MNSNEYMRNYMRERWKKRRSDAIELLGGVCVKCGSIDNLEFDHIDSTKKSFSITKNHSMNKKQWDEELKKCQLLCSDCHSEKTKECGDIGDRERVTICDCGRTFYTINSYAGHKKWCK